MDDEETHTEHKHGTALYDVLQPMHGWLKEHAQYAVRALHYSHYSILA